MSDRYSLEIQGHKQKNKRINKDIPSQTDEKDILMCAVFQPPLTYIRMSLGPGTLHFKEIETTQPV